MSPDTRRTIRFDDDPWTAGQAKAAAAGETLTAVLRWLLDAYLADNHHSLDGYHYEYRATPKDPALTDIDRAKLTVEGIAGQFDIVRRLYPAKTWRLEERIVSRYRTATRKSAAN